MMDCSTDRKWTNSFFPSASIDAIRGESEFSRFIMDIIKLRLQNRPWGAVYETPVFDSATGGFVDVDGGHELNFPGSVNLSAPPVSRRASSAGFGKKVPLSIFKANR